MKYMTFNSSCSYAGLANLLSACGVDTEDRQIALAIQLPYLFAKDNGQYLSGPMLQGGTWFNLYLNPIGFHFSEQRVRREEACAFLQINHPAMLGVRISPKSKHAVIFTGQENGKYHFLNNKHQESAEPDHLYFLETELQNQLDEMVVIGVLRRAKPAAVNLLSYLDQSITIFSNLQTDIYNFCSFEQSSSRLQEAQNNLFRPLLLDGVTMLELLEEVEISGMLKEIRRQFLGIIREKRPARLEKELDMAKFRHALEQYYDLLVTHQKTMKMEK